MSVKTGADRRLLLYLAVLVAACRTIGSVVLPAYDDAFITLRYARNLAAGHGLVYHPHEWVLGVTTPVFALLCSVPHLLHLPIPGTVIALNVLLDVATLLLTVSLIPAERRTVWGPVFAGFFALSPVMTRVCVGGMEMSLFLLASLGALALSLHGRRQLGILVAAVGCFLRPEGILLLGILLVLAAWRGGVRALARGTGTAVAVVLPPCLVLQVLYGSPLPQSLRAKAAADLMRPSALQVLQKFLAYDALLVVCLPLAAWGVWGAVRDRASALQRLLGVWAACYVAAYVVARPHIWSWYGEPVFYVILVLAAGGASELLCRLRLAAGRPGAAGLARAVAIAAALPVAIWLAVLHHDGRSGVTRHVFAPLREWCRANAADTASFLASDIGALGYFSDGRIYDRAGLVWPEASRYGTDADVIAAYAPDFLFLNTTQGVRDLMEGSPVGRLYRPIGRFSKTGRRDFDLRDAPPANVWVQDYILYRRAPAAPDR